MPKNIYLFLTQLTVIIHLLFIAFVIVGGFFALRKRWIMVVHLIAVVWAIYAELSPGIICPLTTLENFFGYRAGLSTYEEDFVTRYFIPIIYQEDLTRNVQFVLAGIVVGINVLVYAAVWRQRRAFGSREQHLGK